MLAAVWTSCVVWLRAVRIAYAGLSHGRLSSSTCSQLTMLCEPVINPKSDSLRAPYEILFWKLISHLVMWWTVYISCKTVYYCQYRMITTEFINICSIWNLTLEFTLCYIRCAAKQVIFCYALCDRTNGMLQ